MSEKAETGIPVSRSEPIRYYGWAIDCDESGEPTGRQGWVEITKDELNDWPINMVHDPNVYVLPENWL
jgi:hypothetical protein